MWENELHKSGPQLGINEALRLHISLGILRLGTFGWKASLENFLSGFYDWELSFGMLCLATPGVFRFRTFAWAFEFGSYRLGYARLITFVRERSL